MARSSGAPKLSAFAGSLPNDDAIIRLVGALLLEQNDEWGVQRARYTTLEPITQMSDDPLIGLPAVASRSSWPVPESSTTSTASYTTLRDMICGRDNHLH